jgi:acid phosphatase type 7
VATARHRTHARPTWSSRRRSRVPRALLTTLAAAALFCGCGGGSVGQTAPGPPSPDTRGHARQTPRDVPRDAPTLLAAGDIAKCDSDGDEQTARLARRLPKAQIAAIGDLAYERGTAIEFARCWGPSWGKLGNRVHPAAGNHEYGTGVADDYFRYFGPRAGPAGKGWYSYEIGTWHIVVLNSNCGIVGCAPGSEQEQWLRADLAQHRDARCTLAYWHHPRRSSGLHGDDKSVEPLRQALIDAHADILLQGHDHDYERFAPRKGLREWVVGTGGAENYPIGPGQRGSQVRWSGGHGLLALTLRPGGYEWHFLVSGGADFGDAGRGRCS